MPCLTRLGRLQTTGDLPNNATMNRHATTNEPEPSDRLCGKLFIVGTPIGNLEDISLRAIRALKEVQYIACEDTRRTQVLLNHYGIKTPTLSYHEHNEKTRAPELVARLEHGENISLVSDAGTPLISDPGYRLVEMAIRRGIPVVPIPGPSALVAALSAAGLPVERFRFIGFLPPRRGARRKALETLKSAEETLIFYEAPQRALEMLEAIRETFADRRVVVARELTKVHEEFIRGTVTEVLDCLNKSPVRGEITVLVGPAADNESRPPQEHGIAGEVRRLMAEQGLDERGALKALARDRKISRSEAYRRWQMEKNLEW